MCIINISLLFIYFIWTLIWTFGIKQYYLIFIKKKSFMSWIFIYKFFKQLFSLWPRSCIRNLKKIIMSLCLFHRLWKMYKIYNLQGIPWKMPFCGWSVSLMHILSSAEPAKSSPVKEFGKLMDKVVFVLSGFQNPYRAELREKALEMGAQYRPDWGRGCTHLV